ncbi:zinc finger, CCHC-type containing protein [Tanacetum coccineum]
MTMMIKEEEEPIPPHSRNRDDNRQHGKEESFSQDYNEEMRKPRDFSKVKCYNCNEYGHYASHCRKRVHRTNIWFAKDYDHEDSKFGEIILEEDKEGQDQEHDKLRLNENEDIEDTAIVIPGENIGPKPNLGNPNPQAKRQLE